VSSLRASPIILSSADDVKGAKSERMEWCKDFGD
jgi:hypothetical protein